MTSNTTRALFGGALFAAGLIAPAAQAQNLSFQYSFGFTLAYDYPAKNQFGSDAFAGAGPFSISAAVDGASASIDHNNLAMTNKANSAHKGYIGGGYTVYSYFQSDTTGNLNISWDFSGDVEPGGNYLDSHLGIFDADNGFANIFYADLNNPIGSMQVPVTAGTQYYLNGLTIALAGAGDSFYQVSVPTPGAAGLLGIAGLAAARRRRTIS